MNNMEPVNLELKACESVKCKFFLAEDDLLLGIEISGTCEPGSTGENYRDYLTQQIGLAMVTYRPLVVLVDLRELNYSWGDRILPVFDFSNQFQFYEKGFILQVIYVLSNKNKAGITSLLRLKTSWGQLNYPFFTDYTKAYQRAKEEVAKI